MEGKPFSRDTRVVPRNIQGGHKPGILRDFSEHGKLREFCEFCATSGKNCNKAFLVRH